MEIRTSRALKENFQSVSNIGKPGQIRSSLSSDVAAYAESGSSILSFSTTISDGKELILL